MNIVIAIIVGFTVIVLGMMLMATVTAAWPLFLALLVVFVLIGIGKTRCECCHQCCCGD